MPLWLDRQPLVLASKSDVRGKLLAAAGIPFEIRPAHIDERAVEASAGAIDRGRGGAAAGARQGAGRGGHASRPAGARRRPDAGARRARASASPPIAPPRRAVARAARPHARTAFGARAGARRRGAVRLRRYRAADHARRSPTVSSTTISTWRAMPRCAASAAISSKASACICSRRSRAIISPSSACRCCRCSAFLRQNKFVDG